MRWIDAEERYGRLLAMVAALCLLAMCLPADAQTVAVDAAKVTWVNATQMSDGSPIPATGDNALKETQIQRGSCNADGTFGVVQQQVNVLPTVLMVLFENLPPAKYCFRGLHVTNGLRNSNWSGVASKTTVAPPPPIQKTKPPVITVG